MSETIITGTAARVALVEILLDVLFAADMALRLSVSEAVLTAATELGASRETAGALLEAINGNETERIRRLADRMQGEMRARGPAAAPIAEPGTAR